MNRHLDFLLFQTFTDMTYSDAKSFNYELHVVNIEGKNYINGHHMKTEIEFVAPILPITYKTLERNNYKIEITSIKVQPVPQRYRYTKLPIQVVSQNIEEKIFRAWK